MLLVQAAFASPSSDADLASWGEVDDDVLAVDDDSVSFEPGEMTSFSLSLHLRLVEGDGLTLQAGEAAFTLDYSERGGLRLGDEELPFGVDELAFAAPSEPVLAAAADWEAGGLAEPAIVAWGEDYRLYYAAGDGIGVATSPDLESWTRYAEAVLEGGSPSAVVVEDELWLYYRCDEAICRASSEDGLSFAEEGVVVDAGDRPAVALDEEGDVHLWYVDGDTVLHATSDDGLGFDAGEAVDARIAGADVGRDAYGWYAVYSVGDGIGWAVGGEDPSFSASDDDVVPLLSDDDASWSDGGIGDPAAIYLDTLPVLAYAGGETPRIGLGTAVPAPGAWGGLELEWDGSDCRGSWKDGPSLVMALDAASGFTLSVAGSLEVDEVLVEWTTEELGDSGGGETGPAETGGAETGAGETGGLDSAGDSAAFSTAAEEAFEPGGFGCRQGAAAPGAWALLALLGLRRRP